MDEHIRPATAIPMGQSHAMESHAMEAIAPSGAMQRAENEGWPPGRLPASRRPGFVSRITGRGRIWLQSRSLDGLAAWTNARLI